MKHSISAALAVLCARFLTKKEEEALAIAARRAEGDAILALDEVKANEAQGKTVNYENDEFTLEIRYVEKVEIDPMDFGKGLPPEAMQRCFIMKPEFSKSGFNAYIKQLEGLAVHDPAMRKLKARVEKAYTENRKATPQAAQISVKKL